MLFGKNPTKLTLVKMNFLFLLFLDGKIFSGVKHQP